MVATFQTHVTVAAFAGGLIAVAGWRFGGLSIVEVSAMAAWLTLGGIAPDIDADQSHAAWIVFTVIGVAAAIAAGTIGGGRLQGPGIICAVLGSYIGSRHVGVALFRKLTVHRGLWHSLLATAFAGLLVVAGTYRLLRVDPLDAWMQGLSLCMGMVIHLTLDEIYSVDVVGGRLKRSFGTALKFYDYGVPASAITMLVAMLALMPWLPPFYTLGGAWRGMIEIVAHIA